MQLRNCLSIAVQRTQIFLYIRRSSFWYGDIIYFLRERKGAAISSYLGGHPSCATREGRSEEGRGVRGAVVVEVSRKISTTGDL